MVVSKRWRKTMTDINPKRKISHMIWFILLCIVSIYFIVKCFLFVGSSVETINKNGFMLFKKFPLSVISDVIKYILCTLLFIYLSIKQGFTAFSNSKTYSIAPAIFSGIALLALLVSETAKFFAFKSLLSSYKLVLYLKSLLSLDGIITVAVLIFTAIYFVYKLAQKRADSASV